MAHLFSPLTIAGVQLSNRIVMAPHPSGFATIDGFIDDAFYDYYMERANGGVGLVILEPARVMRPFPDASRSHLGLYDDVFVPRLRRLVQAMQGSGTRVLVQLEASPRSAHDSVARVRALLAHFLRAAWRAQAAGCDGVMLSGADGGVLHTLMSPLSNRRTDMYGGSTLNRMRLPLEILEGIRTWLGQRFLIGFRMVAEEFAPNGITLQDARVGARRLVGAGANLLDVMTDTRAEAPVAQFPGWRVPLAGNLKRVLPDVPLSSSGLLGDPRLADSVIREGSIDLVMLGRSLRTNPYWAHIARIILASDHGIYPPEYSADVEF